MYRNQKYDLLRQVSELTTRLVAMTASRDSSDARALASEKCAEQSRVRVIELESNVSALQHQAESLEFQDQCRIVELNVLRKSMGDIEDIASSTSESEMSAQIALANEKSARNDCQKQMANLEAEIEDHVREAIAARCELDESVAKHMKVIAHQYRRIDELECRLAATSTTIPIVNGASSIPILPPPSIETSSISVVADSANSEFDFEPASPHSAASTTLASVGPTTSIDAVDERTPSTRHPSTTVAPTQSLDASRTFSTPTTYIASTESHDDTDTSASQPSYPADAARAAIASTIITRATSVRQKRQHCDIDISPPSFACYNSSGRRIREKKQKKNISASGPPVYYFRTKMPFC